MGKPDAEAEATGSQPDHMQPTEDEIREFPSKYIGYRDLTNYIASDSDFFAVRRFDRLHTRAIITIQAQLAEDEAELDALDYRYGAKYVNGKRMMVMGPHESPEYIEVPPGGFTPEVQQVFNDYYKDPRLGEPRHVDNGSVKHDMLRRKQLILKIIDELEVYDTLLLNYSRLHDRPCASKWNIRNLTNWFSANPGAISGADEDGFLHHHERLVTLQNEKPLTRRFFEQKIVFRTGRALGLFQKKRPPPVHHHGSDSDSSISPGIGGDDGGAGMMSARDRRNAYMYSDEAIDKASFVALLVTTLVMLVAPLWILQALRDVTWKLGVITAFAIVWLTFFSFTTGQGRPFEKMAATAGYLAVLVVFLQFGEPAVTVNVQSSPATATG